ncbi:MAG: AAA family ATPase [Porticoccaceae bacterium]
MQLAAAVRTLFAVNADTLHPRFAVPALTDALANAPVVLIHGPRQCGKTTLARKIAESNDYAYFSQ